MNEAFIHTKSKLQRKKMARPGQAGQKIPLRASLLSASEREFKVAKNIQAQRVRLLPRNVEGLLFLKYNLRALSYPDE